MAKRSERIPRLRPLAITSIPVEISIVDGYDSAVKAVETAYFRAVLGAANGCISFAAKSAGMDRNTFRRHARACGVLNDDS
jgi:transcriptional regulator of acetoin/glycerol metabolism